MAVCKACKKEFVKLSNRQVYCCDDCKEAALKQQWRNASHKYYHAHKHEWGHNSVRRYGLGTGTLGPHTRDNFTEEHSVVRKELARLKLVKGNV